MKIKFIGFGYRNRMGYAVIKKGVQSEPTHHCKEVFAREVLRKYNPEDKTFSFIRKDGKTKDPKYIEPQLKVIHAFEKKMGFKPLSKCVQIIRPPTKAVPNIWGWESRATPEESYFLYTVSNQWAKSLPLLHILALLVRNYFGMEGKISYDDVASLWKQKNKWPEIRKTIFEIVENHGDLPRQDVAVGNGISDYSRALKLAGLTARNGTVVVHVERRNVG